MKPSSKMSKKRQLKRLKLKKIQKNQLISFKKRVNKK